MKLEINNYMSIEVSEPNELLELMTDEEKLELVESLSCHDAVIKHVADQLIYGCTENGRSGSVSGSGTPNTPLDVAAREIANASSDIAKKEISRLEALVKRLEDQNVQQLKSMFNVIKERS